jgi:hypothetical protein
MLWAIATMAALVCAQEKTNTPAAAKIIQKAIEVKYADANRVANLVQAPGLIIRGDSSMHAVVVYGASDAVTAVEEMLRKLDVAPPNIEMIVYLIAGSSQAGAEDVPKELLSTTRQLHVLFPYKTYRVLDSFVQRSRDGRGGDTNGVLPGSNLPYSFRFNSATVSAGTPRVIHIDRLNLNVRSPTSEKDKQGNVVYKTHSGIETDIDAGEGQKIVVGKSSVGETGDALILVLTAKVVE